MTESGKHIAEASIAEGSREATARKTTSQTSHGSQRASGLKLAMATVMVLLVGACGSSSKTSETKAAVADSTQRPDASTSDNPEGSTTQDQHKQAQWEFVSPGGDCECSDGSEYTFSVHKGDPDKVMFYLQGGGACFDSKTCDLEHGQFQVTAHPTGENPGSGIFDFENDENPFKDWSVVAVSYCTGDLHLGTATHDYGDGLVINHVGFINAKAAMNEAFKRFPAASQIVVAGESAGSAPAPLYAGLFADHYPEAKIAVLADGSGAYPNVAAINAAIGGLWGHTGSIPPNWASTKGVTAETWSLPGLFTYTHEEHPEILFSRHDYAYDDTQVFFGNLAGFDANNLLTLIDKNETEEEASGAQVDSYISPDFNHTVLSKPDFYSETLNGTRLVDWVEKLAQFEPPGDVHCLDCGSPKPTTTQAQSSQGSE